MPIDFRGVIRRGYERTVARSGLQIAVILFVISILDAMFSIGLEQQPMPPDGLEPPGMGPTSDIVTGAPPVSLELPPIVAGILSLFLGLGSIVVVIGAIRTFVSDETETLRREYFTENILWAALNLIVGSIVFGIALVVGFILLVVPGLFLLVSLFFWEVFVAVEGDNIIEGFRNSWSLTGGRRLRLFALGVAILFIAMIVSIVFAIPGVFLPRTLGFLIEQIGSALVGVFLLTTVAETYTQLVAMSNEA